MNSDELPNKPSRNYLLNSHYSSKVIEIKMIISLVIVTDLTHRMGEKRIEESLSLIWWKPINLIRH